MFSKFFAEYLPIKNITVSNNYKKYNASPYYNLPLYDLYNKKIEEIEEEQPSESVIIPEINIPIIQSSESVEQKDNQQKQTSSVRQNIVDTARQHVGGRYIWGGNGKEGQKGGFDCSGLIYYAYTQNGADKKKMPRQSSLFEKHGKKISMEEAQEGDIIHTNGHVLMLSQKVDGEWYVIEAAGTKRGIVERPISQSAAKNPKNIISVRNYVDYLYFGGKLIPRYRYIK